jgi:hypothetical protein
MDNLAAPVHRYMDVQVRPAEMVEAQVNFGMHITLVPQVKQLASELEQWILLRLQGFAAVFTTMADLAQLLPQDLLVVQVGQETSILPVQALHLP